jgi:hypothetical protein
MRPENFTNEQGLQDFKIPDYVVKQLESNPLPDEEPFIPSEFDLKPGRTPDILTEDPATKELSNEKLSVKETGNENVGRGLYAFKDFEADEDVFEFNGKQRGESFHPAAAMDNSTSHSIVVGQKGKPYFVYAAPNKYSPLRYLNHSCEPNIARVSDDLFGFKALRPIKAGEELTADYSLLETNPYWKMDCDCGSKNCRHKIGSVSSLPADYLYQNWHRLIPEMQVTAIEYSRDPKIAELRDELGADCLPETDPSVAAYIRKKIIYSTDPEIAKLRNELGADRMLETISSPEEEDTREKIINSTNPEIVEFRNEFGVDHMIETIFPPKEGAREEIINSSDPKIVKRRNHLGAHLLLETNPSIVKCSREEIINSSEEDIIKKRNLLGAKKLAERFLDEVSFAPAAKNN